MAKFIVIDGLDGSGKATQTELLKQYLEGLGKRVVKVSFPNYESDSSFAVKMYLGGKLGDDPSKLNPYMCSSFYAIDRAIQFYTELEDYFKEDDNTIILSDRYLSANIIHQGSKLKNIGDRHNFIKWCYDYECKLMQLPKEDLTIILTVKPETSQKLMSERYNNDESKKDIHEANLGYLNNCYSVIKDTVDFISLNSDIPHWIEIECDKQDNTLYTIDEIHNTVCKIVDDMLNHKKIKTTAVKGLVYDNRSYWEKISR